MKNMKSKQIAVLVILTVIAAYAIDQAVDTGDNVSSAGFVGSGGNKGFKGSDEELQVGAPNRSDGFKGSDEELQAVGSKTGK